MDTNSFTSLVADEYQDLRIIYNNAGTGIATLSQEGHFLQVNPKMCELTGYSSEELLERQFSDLLHTEEAGFLKSNRTALSAEKRYIHKYGQVLWARISITPVKGPDEEIEHWVVVFEDVTERRLSEDLLRNQKEVLELIAKNISLSETLARIVRLIEEQAPGALSTIYLVKDGKLRLGAAPSWPESFVRAVEGCPIGPYAGSCGAAAFSGKRIVSTNISKDPWWLEHREWIMSYGIHAAWSTPVLSKDGTVLGTVSMCWKEPKEPTARHFELVDVAVRLMGIAIERESTQEILVAQQAKMLTSSKLAALGEMAAGLAHEINNPLAVISASADQLNLLVEHSLLKPEILQEISVRMRSTTQRISKIIKGLRSFARDGEKDAFQDVPIQTIVDETLAFCRERFRIHGVNLISPEIPPEFIVHCRPVQLSQVLLNLLNNSYDAIENLPERWIRIEVADLGSSFLISVTDSGSGIPEDLRDSIMQPFFTTKEVGKGTGLGLSISTGIVASHNGRLWLETQSFNTQFKIELPKDPRSLK